MGEECREAPGTVQQAAGPGCDGADKEVEGGNVDCNWRGKANKTKRSKTKKQTVV